MMNREGKYLGRKGISDIKPYIPGKPVQEVKRELGLQDVIKLASNENPLGPSPLAMKAMREAVEHIHLYPDAESCELGNALSETLGVPADHLIFGNGGEEIITLIGKAFVNEGEPCVIPHPTFDAYETVVRIMGGVVCFSDLTEYRINLDDMARRIDEETKLVFICNPMNPTGTIVARDELNSFLGKIPPETLVVLDEAYCHFVSDPGYPDGIEYVRRGTNVIVLRTFSKVYGLGGIRIGYGVSKPELIHLLRQVKEPFNVNVLAQVGALAALRDQEHLEKTVTLIHRERDFLYGELSGMGLKFIPTEANFIFINVGGDSTVLFQRMLERGIVVRPGTVWQLPHFIRLTIGKREQNLRFIRALRDILNLQS
jgi:histidinol-phosphate aminotransferase